MFLKQAKFALSGLTPDRGGIHVSHYVGGRGSGKTVAGIVRLFRVCAALGGRANIAWTEPSFRDIDEIFWQTLEAVVPRKYWRREDGGRRVILCGTRVSLVSREHRNSHVDVLRGPTYCGIFHDELGKDASRRAWVNGLGAVRGNYPIQRFIATMSNPSMGWFHEAVTGDTDAYTLYCKTSENPYNGDLDVQTRHHLDARTAARELDAQWIADTNAVYPDWTDGTWPNGNRHPHIWNPQAPWQLWLDPGVVRSAWLVVQSVEDWTRPGQLVDVVVAEIVGKADGLGAREVARPLREWVDKEAGRPNPPRRIIYDPSGNNRAVDSNTHSVRRELESVWGAAPHYDYPRGSTSDHDRSKEVQLTVARGRICNAFGRRGFCVSEQLISDGRRIVHDPKRPGSDSSPSKRGVLEVMRELALPDPDGHGDAITAKSLDTLLSDGRLEHVNDAILYGNIVNHRLDGRMTYYTERN